jgi:DNA polymerase sigma
MVICLPKVHWEAGPEAPGVLEGRNAIKETWQQNLARYLQKESWVQPNSIKVIGNTAIPLLKLRANTESSPDIGGRTLSLDVSFEGQGHKGLEANKYICALMVNHPTLRPLMLVLKYYLTKKSLGESFTGGLSSYALLLLMARFLQETTSTASSSNCFTESVCDIGAQLLGFLCFFGGKFDPRQTGISVKRRCFFSRAIYGPVVQASYHPAESMDSDSYRRQSTNYHSRSVHSSVSSATYLQMASTSSTPTQAPPHQMLHASFGHPRVPFVPFKFDPLFIEDPLERRNNVGRNCFRVFQVQRLFNDAYAHIISVLKKIDNAYENVDAVGTAILPEDRSGPLLLGELIGDYSDILPAHL